MTEDKNMPYEFNFDYTRFEKLMVESYSPFFEELKQEHSNERIFAYALLSLFEFESMTVCITDKNSDWLTCPQLQWQNVRLPETDIYGALDYFPKLASRRMRASRRFSNMIITARTEGVSEEDSVEMQKPLLEEYRQACINALTKMDKNGIFGTGDKRKNVAVFISFYGSTASVGRVLIHSD